MATACAFAVLYRVMGVVYHLKVPGLDGRPGGDLTRRMDITFYLFFIALLVSFAAWCLFLWAIRTGQFRDVEDIKYQVWPPGSRRRTRSRCFARGGRARGASKREAAASRLAPSLAPGVGRPRPALRRIACSAALTASACAGPTWPLCAARIAPAGAASGMPPGGGPGFSSTRDAWRPTSRSAPSSEPSARSRWPPEPGAGWEGSWPLRRAWRAVAFGVSLVGWIQGSRRDSHGLGVDVLIRGGAREGLPGPSLLVAESSSAPCREPFPAPWSTARRRARRWRGRPPPAPSSCSSSVSAPFPAIFALSSLSARRSCAGSADGGGPAC